MLVAAVGTFIAGFDALVEAADRTCMALGQPGFAQIGQSRYVPERMDWQRFLPHVELVTRFQAARLVVCHAGMGIVGEAMRAGVPIILFPRQGETSALHPANDQTPLALRLAARHGLAVCHRPADLPELASQLLGRPKRRSYRLASDVPTILADWLSRPRP